MATVSIVGGGIAGLALAATIDNRLHDVTVYEERPDRPPAGTGLGMWPSAMRALDSVGLGEAVRNASADVCAGAIRDRHDRPLISHEAARAYVIARPALLSILRDAAADVEQATMRVERHDQVTADLTIAADGVHSAVRTSVFGPRASSRNAGIVIFRGVATGRGDVQTASEFWDAGTIGGLMPLRGPHRNWYLAVRTPPELTHVTALDDSDCTEHALRYAARLPDRLSDAIRHTADPLFQHLWVSPATAQLHRGRVALVGDAAHAMTPNLGRGACESIVDAVTLGQLLNRHDLSTAVRRYAVRRALPTLALKGASRAVLRLSTAHRGVGVRDRALRLLGSAMDRS